MLDWTYLVLRRHRLCWSCQIGRDGTIIAPLPLTAEATREQALRHVLCRYPSAAVYTEEAGTLTQWGFSK